MPRRKPDWGTPGQTGVTSDGIPWYVPDKPPGFVERMMYTAFPGNGTSGIPAGARFVPARTPDEVLERVMRKYHDSVASVLDDGEDIVGFIGFALNDRVPQPPRFGLEAKIGPNPLQHWWMGGDWDSMAGQLLRAIGSSRQYGTTDSVVADRQQIWIRTSRRVVIAGWRMSNPTSEYASYSLDQVGIHPGWQPHATDDVFRVDIAYADGSWLGLEEFDEEIPGPMEGFPARDLLARLAGPPVTAAPLPPIRR